MGYNIEIVRSTAAIPAGSLDEAYRRMVALNTTHHDKKRGGRLGGPPVTNGSDRWFSWMDWDYPDHCKDAGEILDQLGFFISYDEDGSLRIDGYDSKAGQEDLFIESIADLFTAGGIIEWIGEDDLRWRWVFDGVGVIAEQGRTTYG